MSSSLALNQICFMFAKAGRSKGSSIGFFAALCNIFSNCVSNLNYQLWYLAETTAFREHRLRLLVFFRKMQLTEMKNIWKKTFLPQFLVFENICKRNMFPETWAWPRCYFLIQWKWCAFFDCEKNLFGFFAMCVSFGELKIFRHYEIFPKSNWQKINFRTGLLCFQLG